MSDVKKPSKPKTGKPRTSKPKAAAKRNTAKAKTDLATKKTAKTSAGKRAGAPRKTVAKVKTKAKIAKPRKPRGPNKPRVSGSFAELLSVQALFEKSKQKARKELKQEYAGILKNAEKIKAQYSELFGESIDGGGTARRGRPKVATGGKVKTRKTGAKKPAGVKPFSLKEVEGFLEMKAEGLPVKLAGRRSKSVTRLEEAYKQTQDAKGIMALLNQ
jgi:hypothetical protein